MHTSVIQLHRCRSKGLKPKLRRFRLSGRKNMSRSNHVTPPHLTNQTIHREIHAPGSSQPTFSLGLRGSRARSTETGLETTRRASTAEMSRQGEEMGEARTPGRRRGEKRRRRAPSRRRRRTPSRQRRRRRGYYRAGAGGQAPRRWGPGLLSSLGFWDRDGRGLVRGEPHTVLITTRWFV